MQALKNKVQLIGRLARPCELRLLEGGRRMARFTIAIDEQYKNAKGEKQTQRQWHTMTVFGPLADVLNRHQPVQGSELAVEGRLVSRHYTDAQGLKKYITEIQVNELMLLGMERIHNSGQPEEAIA